MKKEIAMKWAKALESGKYKQTTGELYNGDSGGHCCLGVLCRISEKRGWIHDFLLPENVQAWAGMKSDNGILPPRFKKFWSLSAQNDSAKKSFEQIAKIIRKHWKSL